MLKQFARIGFSCLLLASYQQGGRSAVDPPNGFDPIVRRTIEARSEGGRGFEISGPPLGPWEATITAAGGTRSVSSTDCAALASAVAEFETLPPVKAGWPRPSGEPATLPIPPTRKHGEDWTIVAAGFTPDVAQVNLTIQGSQGPYAGWAAQTLAHLSACADG